MFTLLFFEMLFCPACMISNEHDEFNPKGDQIDNDMKILNKERTKRCVGKFISRF